MVLEANPDYRERIWDFEGSDDPRDKAAVAAMKGKRIPQIGRIEINVISEEQSRWLAFQNGQIDFIDRFGSFSPIAIPDNKLAPDLAAKGIDWDRSVETEMTYYFFNMEDPVFGGVTKEKIALRRAIIMSYDTQEEIRVIRKTQAIALNMPVPPGVVGNDSKYRGIIKNDPALANKLLDYFGYKKGADGYRTLPDGSPLVVVLTSEPQCDQPRIRRAVEEIARRDRRALRHEEKRVLGQHQGRRSLPGDDVGLRVALRLSRRREFHAALLWAEHPSEQPCLLPFGGVRQVLRSDENHAEFAGA